MRLVSILFALCLVACGSDGKDGAAGPAGDSNKAVSSRDCSFLVPTGAMANSDVFFNTVKFSSGDIFVTLQVSGQGRFGFTSDYIPAKYPRAATARMFLSVSDTVAVAAESTSDDKATIEVYAPQALESTFTVTCTTDTL